MGLDLGQAGLHLGVGLDFDFAQLVAQADDVFGEVEQGAAQGAKFAFVRVRAMEISPASF